MSKPVPMHVSEQEIRNIEGSSGMNAVKDYQIFQPNNATAIMPLAKRLTEDPMDVSVEWVSQLGTLCAAWVVVPFTNLSPCGLAFVLIQISHPSGVLFITRIFLRIQPNY